MSKPGKLTVLAIDDEPDVQAFLDISFRKEIRKGQIEIFYAYDGQAGLKILYAYPEINIVLLDINMPKMDGIAVLEKIHAESFLGQRFVYTKVIVITAYFELKYVRQVMSAGAFDFIVKPVKMEELRGSIGRAVYEISKFKSLARRCEECEQLKRKTTKIFETPEENRKNEKTKYTWPVSLHGSG